MSAAKQQLLQSQKQIVNQKLEDTNLSKNVEVVFKRIDTNNNGRLSRKELTQGLKELKLPSTEEDVDALIASLPKSDNGKITLEELKKFVIDRQHQLRAIFNAIDTNGNGTLDEDEVKASLEKMGMDYTDAAVKRLMHRLDQNKNGVIDFDEWSEFLLLVPQATTEAIFRYWQDASALAVQDTVMIEKEEMSTWKDTFGHLLAGGCAGIASRTATAPLERLKILFQISQGKPPGIMETLKGIYDEGGIKAFYRGNAANLLKVTPEMAIKLMSYDKIKEFFAEDEADITAYQRFLAGGLAGMICHTSCFPLEVIKMRLSVTKKGEPYNGIADVVRQVYKHEGPRAFYKGLGATLASTFPHNGVQLTTFETLREAMIRNKLTSEKPGVLPLLCCTTAAGMVGQAFSYPFHVVAARLATQNTPGLHKKHKHAHHDAGPPEKYDGMLDCFKKIIKRNGLSGLYRGIGPTLMKSIPSQGVTLIVYEYFKRYLHIEKKHHKH